MLMFNINRKHGAKKIDFDNFIILYDDEMKQNK